MFGNSRSWSPDKWPLKTNSHSYQAKWLFWPCTHHFIHTDHQTAQTHSNSSPEIKFENGILFKYSMSPRSHWAHQPHMQSITCIRCGRPSTLQFVLPLSLFLSCGGWRVSGPSTHIQPQTVIVFVSPQVSSGLFQWTNKNNTSSCRELFICTTHKVDVLMKIIWDTNLTLVNQRTTWTGLLESRLSSSKHVALENKSTLL